MPVRKRRKKNSNTRNRFIIVFAMIMIVIIIAVVWLLFFKSTDGDFILLRDSYWIDEEKLVVDDEDIYRNALYKPVRDNSNKESGINFDGENIKPPYSGFEPPDYANSDKNYLDRIIKQH